MIESSLEAEKYPSQILCLNEEIKFTERTIGKIKIDYNWMKYE